MNAPVTGINAADEASAEALLSSLKSIAAAERRRHASVFNYWLSIRGEREFPPIRDLDPLEISDAGPRSVLLEMIGGEDADIRHVGQSIKFGIDAERLSEAPSPSLLSCIASKLPIVAATRQPFAFEDEFTTPTGKTRCSVTLLPFGSGGPLIDYVYGFVSLEPPPSDETAEPEADIMESPAPQEGVPNSEVFEEPAEEAPVFEEDEVPEPEVEVEAESSPRYAAQASKPALSGFSAKIFESLASVSGFYGKVVEVPPTATPEIVPEVDPMEPTPVEDHDPVSHAEETAEVPELEANPQSDLVEEPEAEQETVVSTVIEEASTEADEPPAPAPDPIIEKPAESSTAKTKSNVEGPLQTKLTEVRAIADEARQAKLRANLALYEGLSAAYDFALEAESNAEEYLKLVEKEGLKIQLRSPMAPVVKLAFNGLCDDQTIAQLEAVLAWALKNDLPRGSLAERIESAGGIAPILNEMARAA